MIFVMRFWIAAFSAFVLLFAYQNCGAKRTPASTSDDTVHKLQAPLDGSDEDLIFKDITDSLSTIKTFGVDPEITALVELIQSCGKVVGSQKTDCARDVINQYFGLLEKKLGFTVVRSDSCFLAAKASTTLKARVDSVCEVDSSQTPARSYLSLSDCAIQPNQPIATAFLPYLSSRHFRRFRNEVAFSSSRQKSLVIYLEADSAEEFSDACGQKHTATQVPPQLKIDIR